MDSCAIYGLESQGRALCSHTGDAEIIRFYVGTLSPRSEGQVHQIDFDEETNHISRKVYKPKVGEIWQVQSAPNQSNLIALTYNQITDDSSQIRAGVFQLPDPDSKENNSELKTVWQFESPEKSLKDEECRCVDWHPTRASRISVVSDGGFRIWDFKGGSPEVHATYKLEDPDSCGGENADQIFLSTSPDRNVNRRNSKVYMGKWNPHLDGNQFSLVAGQSVKGIDIRSMQGVWELKSAHKFQVRDIDFNPNKQYYFATCGDDCATRFWDIRNPKECLKEVCEHSHWVWRVRYNSFHDQLVLTSGSDSRVVLHALPSISSEPQGHMVYTEGDDGEEVHPPKEQLLEEGVLAKYEEHEDAVYVTEWSSYDPWIFASLSYDGRLVINRVPQSQKYKILL